MIDQAATTAFRALQKRAREEYGSNTQPLLIVYAVESFLRRLAISEHARQMILKGGMLMAASDVRRMTKDADLSAHGIANDEAHIRRVVAEICALEPDPHDGVVIEPESIRAEVTREDAEYHGVRCKQVARLGQARIPFALDFSFGDPGASRVITLESVIDRPAIKLAAYPLELNLAAKIVTAMQRRETSTRDRDFGDLWVTSRLHQLDATDLRGHIEAVAAHRKQPVIALADALAHLPDRQQSYAAMVIRMSYRSPPPERWSDLLAGVIEFVDPLLADSDRRFSHWDPEQATWISAA